MADKQFPAAKQNEQCLASSADFSETPSAPVCNVQPAGNPRPGLSQLGSRLMASNAPAGARLGCEQSLSMTFFFDGTGNNLEADVGTFEHSNVARMYLAHEESDKATGRYKVYLPGIGTYFKEIGDPGGTTTGLAFGAEGEARLAWAFAQFEEKLVYHAALAQNPSNKITLIRVAAFGFSRGATLARAFARMFQERCEQRAGSWVLKNGGYPVRFYFLGLWDTVASVGLPMSANNMPLAQSAGWMGTQKAMAWRQPSAVQLAFGRAGADPSPGGFDGHMGWAHPLDVVSMVEQCVHMVAAHEMRNSFPLDSCLRNASYAASVQEMAYPGVHSDVGGGYRPGEGGRSIRSAQALSLIPLRAMHQLSFEAGVTLWPMSSLPTTLTQISFATDDASQPDFNHLTQLWDHYMNHAGRGGKGLGETVNAHMRLYYAWRFYRIRQNMAEHAAGQSTPDEIALRQSENQWRQERDALEREIAPAREQAESANRREWLARSRLDQARQNERDYGMPVDPQLVAAHARAQTEAEAPNDRYRKLQARCDTLPGTQGDLARNLRLYDQQLLADAQAIRQQSLADPSLRMRPHYRNLLDAYTAEFVEEQGLRDERLIEFFETYVHDSLAGFALDATLPSDPRVVYVGDDVKSRHAVVEPVHRHEAPEVADV